MNEAVDFLRDMQDFSWLTPFVVLAFPPLTKRILSALKAMQAWTKAIEDHQAAIAKNTAALQVLAHELREHSSDGHGGQS